MNGSLSASTLPFAAEAAWSAGKWDQLERLLGSLSSDATSSADFNVGVGRALLSLRKGMILDFQTIISNLRETLAKDLSPSMTASVQASHGHLVRLHALYEIETISGTNTQTKHDRNAIIDSLDRRLDIIGAYTSDKQYLLGVRRAAMTLSR